MGYHQQLICSIAIRVVAFVWSMALIFRVRDWRIGLMSLMLLLMAAQQSLRFFSIESELPGTVVSVLALLATICIGHLIIAQRTLNEHLEEQVRERTNELTLANQDLQQALQEVKTIKGLVPICSYCHKIRDDQKMWQQLEHYISEHSDAAFSHSVCPECYEQQLALITQRKS